MMAFQHVFEAVGRADRGIRALRPYTVQDVTGCITFFTPYVTFSQISRTRTLATLPQVLGYDAFSKFIREHGVELRNINPKFIKMMQNARNATGYPWSTFVTEDNKHVVSSTCLRGAAGSTFSCTFACTTCMRLL